MLSTVFPRASACGSRLLLTSQLSPEQRELADTILDSSLSLLGTLGDILDFSLLEAAPEVRTCLEAPVPGCRMGCACCYAPGLPWHACHAVPALTGSSLCHC